VATCPTCSTELDDAAQFCPRDGTTIPRAAAPKIAPAAAEPAPSPIAATVAVKTRAPQKPAVEEDPDDPLIGRLIDNRYRVRARLGSGGVGAVYSAEHVEMKRPVAIKVLHGMFGASEEFRKRFEREAQAASRLSHPACVAVLDFGRVSRVEPPADAAKLLGMPYLVMEFVRGKLLLERLEAGNLDGREAVEIARGVLGALGHAHALGLVHRDVKPANIMLTPPEVTGTRVKLLDFGLAKDVTGEGEALTQAGMVFGTPGYLSPEQAGGKTVDERADLYALGVVLFEMACGRRLFVRPDPIEIVRAHVSTAPDPPRRVRPSLSRELEAAILRALEKDPARRFATAKEFDAALAACPEANAAPQNKSAARESSTEKPASAGRAKFNFKLDLKKWPPPVPVVAAGGGALALLVLIVIALAIRKPAPLPPAALPVVVAAPQPIAEAAHHHVELAVGYQRKLWCSDALEELDRALRADERVRTDPDVTRTAIQCLTRKTQPKAIAFLVEKVGPGATVALETAARSDGNQEIRQGASRALERLADAALGGGAPGAH